MEWILSLLGSIAAHFIIGWIWREIMFKFWLINPWDIQKLSILIDAFYEDKKFQHGRSLQSLEKQTGIDQGEIKKLLETYRELFKFYRPKGKNKLLYTMNKELLGKYRKKIEEKKGR
ncbi:MAG: hypothetical protein OXI87_19825 [Albidovulum sp.]|nr:hypothetical protein [Albidovulum sp.]